MATRLKLVTVGDEGVGKTSLVTVLQGKPFPDNNTFMVADTECIKYTFEGNPYGIILWDSAGQDELASIRTLSYSNTDAFLICFSLDSKESFNNIAKKWIYEIRTNAKDSVIILVGTKQDLYQKGNPNHVTEIEINNLMKENKCSAFITCSAKTGMNIDNIFSTAMKVINIKEKVKTFPEDNENSIKVLMSYIRFLEDRLSKYEPTKQIDFEKLLNNQDI